MNWTRAAFALVSILIACATCQAVNYRVSFEATWSQENHPAAYPGRNAHFSTPIGTTHNDNVSFWVPGEAATNGVERVAETGSIGSMRSELTAAINDGNAFGIIQGSTFDSPGVNRMVFEALPDFSQVSLISMIAPSPDWFVGVHGLELRNEQGWIPELTVPLAPYDSGTEEGNSFSTANAATSPLGTIQRLDTDPNSLLFEAESFGNFVFELLPLCDLNGDNRCDTDDLSATKGLYSVGDLQAGVAVIPGENSRFDLNSDKTIDSNDLDLWLAEAAAHNGFGVPYLKGDTNLNDHVGFGDFTALSAGFGSGRRDWTDGNYDGSLQTDFADFLALSGNFGKSIPRLGVAAAVPEPSSSALLFVGASILFLRRRSALKIR